MANNRELSEFADFLTVDNTTNNVGIGTTLKITAGGIFVGDTEIISAAGVWGGSNSGLVGAQGAQGVQGATGAQGVQGTNGIDGAQGAQGVQGAVGAQGSQGRQGAVGAQGNQGVQGAVGAQGAQGVQGAVGAQGAQGRQGATGAQGVQGATGPVGGSNTQVLFNSSGSTAGDAGLTFSASGNTLTLGSQHQVVLGSFTNTQRNSIGSTSTGSIMYNTDRESGQIYSGSTKGWVDFGKSQTFIFSENGYYTNSADASADSLYAHWNCNSTSTDKTLGSSGSATLYGVSSGSGWISNNWDRGTSYDNGINLTSMPTGTNMTLAFAFIMTDSTIHSTSDGAGLLWLDSTDTSSVILGYDGSTRVLRAGGNGWVSDGTVIINPLSTNTWYHIVITKSSNDWKYYVNGSNEHNASEAMDNNGNWWFSNYNRHGGNTNNHYHRGRLDEIAVWTRTLSAAEVTALYNAQSAGTPLYNP